MDNNIVQIAPGVDVEAPTNVLERVSEPVPEPAETREEEAAPAPRMEEQAEPLPTPLTDAVEEAVSQSDIMHQAADALAADALANGPAMSIRHYTLVSAEVMRRMIAVEQKYCVMMQFLCERMEIPTTSQASEIIAAVYAKMSRMESADALRNKLSANDAAMRKLQADADELGRQAERATAAERAATDRSKELELQLSAIHSPNDAFILQFSGKKNTSYLRAKGAPTDNPEDYVKTPDIEKATVIRDPAVAYKLLENILDDDEIKGRQKYMLYKIKLERAA